MQLPKTTIAQAKHTNWKLIRKEVNERIDILQALVEGFDDNPLNEAILNDLVAPSLARLAQFCLAIEIEAETQA
jgi:hypothetical protein